MTAETAGGASQRDSSTSSLRTSCATPGISRCRSDGLALLQVRQNRKYAPVVAFRRGKPREDVEAAVVASALMGAQRTLVDYVRASVMAGRRGPELTADARTQGRRAFKRLERGLADYAIKR
jgi:hypothetical protein